MQDDSLSGHMPQGEAKTVLNSLSEAVFEVIARTPRLHDMSIAETSKWQLILASFHKKKKKATSCIDKKIDIQTPLQDRGLDVNVLVMLYPWKLA